MANKRRVAVPNPEWVLMYRGGLTAQRISKLTGAPPSTVSYHLRLARAADTGLAAAHEAVRPRTTKVTGLGVDRMQQLVAMARETGRYPSRHSQTKEERTLAVWLQRRRGDARVGRLAPAFRDGLTVLPGWEGQPRSEADEERWQAKLEVLEAYRASGNDWPRHKATITGEEHDLGIWLHNQRYKLRRGQLSPERTGILDAALPGWRTGRTRGRRPADRPLLGSATHS